MSMPVMDGMSATRAIRQYEQEYNVPRCSIIALTGLASASAKLEAWNAGIDHFMTKPVNFKALGKFLKKEASHEKAAYKPADTSKE
jgi:CheY-like chemotaxis protein